MRHSTQRGSSRGKIQSLLTSIAGASVVYCTNCNVEHRYSHVTHLESQLHAETVDKI